MTQLAMKRPEGAADLEIVSSSSLVRAASDRDADGLAKLLQRSFPEKTWDSDRVRRDLLNAPDVPVTFVVADGETIVATASVRYSPRFPDSGYVHWVAVDPEHRGRQLSAAVMARVLQRFSADGRGSAVLETDDVRVPAIVAYLGQGFVPHYLDADHEQRWSRVFQQIVQYYRATRARPS